MINLRHQDNRWRQRSIDLAHRLRRNDPTCTEVSLRPVGGEQQISAAEMASIVQSLINNTTVKVLEVNLATPAEPLVEQQDEYSSGGTFSDDDSYDFGAVEDPARYAKKIDILDFLSKTLEQNTSLQTLVISLSTTSFNNKDDVQWIALRRGLLKNQSIRKLEVSSGGAGATAQTCLSVTACRTLSQILTENTKINFVCLRGIELENTEAVLSLAHGIRNNSSMRQVHLQQIECPSSSAFLLLIDAIASTRAPLDAVFISECEFECIESASHDDDSSCRSDLFEMGDFSEYSDSRSSFCSRSNESLQHHPLDLLASHPLSCLKEICITESIFDQDSFIALCQGLRQAASVQKLDLSGNDLLGSVCAQALADMLTDNTGLKRLILDENILLDWGVAVLCDGLLHNKTLRELSLKANHLTTECCDALSASIAECGLYNLVLSENSIGDSGALELSRGLSCTSTQLRCLSMNACLLSDAGIVPLCQAIASPSSSLEELCLANNRLQCEGAQALSDMLAVNSTLASLDISGCHLKNDAVAVMLQSLTGSGNKKNNNTTLRHLNLAFNALTEPGATSLAQMLRANQSRLVMLSLQCNNFSKEGEYTLVQSVEHNTYLQELYFWSPGNMRFSGGHTGKKLEYDNFSNQLLKKLHQWLALNRAGRCALQDCAFQIELWPLILEHADNAYGENALFYMLREKPDLTMYRSRKK